MDILYIVGRNSRCFDFELRCSLRSIAENGRNVGKVYVVGHCPDWLSDEVVKIPCDDFNKDTFNPLPKAQNIAKKLLYAVDNSDIGEEFLVSMDDHYYVAPTDFDKYPYYAKMCNGSAYLPTREMEGFVYRNFLADCAERLKELGLPTFYFTLHRNMHASRAYIEECRAIIEENIANGYAFEAFLLLGNYMFSKGVCSPVMKADNRIENGQEWWKTSPEHDNVFSTADFNEGSGLYHLLKGMFNKPSRYEK